MVGLISLEVGKVILLRFHLFFLPVGCFRVFFVHFLAVLRGAFLPAAFLVVDLDFPPASGLAPVPLAGLSLSCMAPANNFFFISRRNFAASSSVANEFRSRPERSFDGNLASSIRACL